MSTRLPGVAPHLLNAKKFWRSGRYRPIIDQSAKPRTMPRKRSNCGSIPRGNLGARFQAQGPQADVCLIQAPSRGNQAEDCNDRSISVYFQQERLVRTGLAAKSRYQESTSFTRLQQPNPIFAAKALRTRSFWDRWQSRMFKHGPSRATHCYMMMGRHICSL